MALDAVLARIHALPAVSPIVVRALQLTYSEQSAPREIANVVASDYRFAGRLVAAANLPCYHLPRRIKTVGEAVKRWGRVDVLVNNAHTFTDYLPIEDPKMVDNIRIDMESAFIGSVQLMQLCFPHMRDQGAGSIINMGSSYGLRCEPGFLAYAASKEAIRALTRTAAKEWGKLGIRVNTVLPSALTPKSIWYLEDSGTYDVELAKVAMGRFGGPDDIAPTAIFLAADESNYVTGQTIGVDGGSTMF